MVWLGGLPPGTGCAAVAAAAGAAYHDRNSGRPAQSSLNRTGNFRSDNLLSNEIFFQYVIPTLRTAKAGRAYMGVGPEQNFTYIAAVKPKMAFIVDVRRETWISI